MHIYEKLAINLATIHELKLVNEQPYDLCDILAILIELCFYTYLV